VLATEDLTIIHNESPCYQVTQATIVPAHIVKQHKRYCKIIFASTNF
jgi:hypothetical protein